jgi:hypothetical protein
MIGRVGLCLVGCVLCVTPVAADEDVHDGPTTIKPLIVRPRPQQSAPSGQVCDFEHQCYPEKGGPMVTAPAAPPAVAAKPIAPQPQIPDEPIVATWRRRWRLASMSLSCLAPVSCTSCTRPDLAGW